MKVDPHFFEASPDMLASDDDFALDRHDNEMDEEGWWNEAGAEARMGRRRKLEHRSERRAPGFRLDDWDLREARYRN
jgi:hypothetical protein